MLEALDEIPQAFDEIHGALDKMLGGLDKILEGLRVMLGGLDKMLGGFSEMEPGFCFLPGPPEVAPESGPRKLSAPRSAPVSPHLLILLAVLVIDRKP
ncbi:MAG: hypothetical protein IT445_12715 [Phycisphaeraceae bacterium]|nr:hypothetical protein [Phycisphaeraceae bacterium]